MKRAVFRIDRCPSFGINICQKCGIAPIWRFFTHAYAYNFVSLHSRSVMCTRTDNHEKSNNTYLKSKFNEKNLFFDGSGSDERCHAGRRE